MAIDMFPHRFIAELDKIHTAPWERVRIPESSQVWEASFPAFRPIFDACLKLSQISGYHLPSFVDFHSEFERCFLKWCASKTTTEGRERAAHLQEVYAQHDAMRQRLWMWYETGMAETWAYLWLAKVLEDGVKQGTVVYDSRIDVKLKADMVVLDHDHKPFLSSVYEDGTKVPQRKYMGKVIPISTYSGDINTREEQLDAREKNERYTKRNSIGSSQINHSMASLQMLELVRTREDNYDRNGLLLFSHAAIRNLLAEVMDRLELNEWQQANGWSFFDQEAKKCPKFTPKKQRVQELGDEPVALVAA